MDKNLAWFAIEGLASLLCFSAAVYQSEVQNLFSEGCYCGFGICLMISSITDFCFFLISRLSIKRRNSEDKPEVQS